MKHGCGGTLKKEIERINFLNDAVISKGSFPRLLKIELYIDDKWILFDNNCTFVADYDHTNPYISVMNPDKAGLFVFAKGVDIWDYRNGNDLLTDEKLLDFSNNIHCYEDLFNTTDYEWND